MIMTFDSIEGVTGGWYPRAHGNVEEIIKIYTWEQERPNLQKLFDYIYQEALLKKADGIINLKVDFVNKPFMDGDYIESITGIKIDGFLIRRVRSSE